MLTWSHRDLTAGAVTFAHRAGVFRLFVLAPLALDSVLSETYLCHRDGEGKNKEGGGVFVVISWRTCRLPPVQVKPHLDTAGACPLS